MAVSPIAEKAKKVLLSPISSNWKISYSGDYIFRIAPSDALQGNIISKWTFNDLSYKNVGILYVNNDYGEGLYQEFRKYFESLGGEILIAESAEQASTDFRTSLAKIKNANPEFIFVAVYPQEAGYIAKQAKELGIDIQIIGTDSFHDAQMLDIAKNAADGILFTDVANVKNEKFSIFSKKYFEKYNSDANIVAAESYDGLNILLHAVSLANSKDSDKVKIALYSISDFEGASGLIGFDENGDVNTKTFNKYIIIDGQYQLLD